VSIAMATFNGEKYISEQLESFSAQSRCPDELVVSDDCSTDSTLDILMRFAQKANFDVKIISNDSTVGYAQNFSRALSQCTGDIVFLSDQDDFWLPEKIEKILFRFRSDSDCQLLIHDVDFCKEDLSRIGQSKIERMKNVYDLDRQYVVGMATAIRGDFLRLCLPIPKLVDMSHDLWLHRCATSIGKKIVMKEVLVMHRRHSFNATRDGGLNVDFVTVPKFFERSFARGKTKVSRVHAETLLTWLKANKSLLVDQQGISVAQVDRLIAGESYRLECITARADILAMGRFSRLWAVLSLFFRGGYNCFSGWKSAIKDLIIS